MKKKEERRNSRAGFTLVEVLLVVAILGILAGVVVGSFAGRQKQVMVRATRTSIAGLCTAVDMYEVDTGRYPPSLNSLVANDGSPNWTGPYVKNAGGQLPKDAWGRDFQYSSDENSYKIWSLGDPKDSKPIEGFSTGAAGAGN